MQSFDIMMQGATLIMNNFIYSYNVLLSYIFDRNANVFYHVVVFRYTSLVLIAAIITKVLALQKAF